jgi:hypothetical protein
METAFYKSLNTAHARSFYLNQKLVETHPAAVALIADRRGCNRVYPKTGIPFRGNRRTGEYLQFG